MKLRLLRDFLPRPLPLKIFIPRSFGHSADTSYPSTNQDREARRHSDKAEHPNPAPIGHFYRFLCRANQTSLPHVTSPQTYWTGCAVHCGGKPTHRTLLSRHRKDKHFELRYPKRWSTPAPLWLASPS